MQSEMISKPCLRFLSVCASIDTEVDRILDRLLRGSKPHAYLLSHFLRPLIFRRNDTLCPFRSCHVSMRSTLALCDSSAFHVWSTKLWLVCIETTDNISISEVVSKTRIENCTVYFDNILNANDSALLHRMEDLSKNVNLSIFLQVKAENIFQPAGESSR